MDNEDLRVRIYHCFATQGRAPSVEELSAYFDISDEVITATLKTLADQRHLVLDDHGNIVMAHPFSAVPLGFSVMGTRTLWWGGCAWDSFALAHLLTTESPVLVATTCPNCSRALSWNVNSSEPPAGDEVAHFLIPAEHMWDDVVHTCGNQRIFCSEECVDGWLTKTANQRGYVMDLTTLWNLASEWYTGRLEPGYVRREPSAAKDYLRSVGLSGPFWGLE